MCVNEPSWTLANNYATEAALTCHSTHLMKAHSFKWPTINVLFTIEKAKWLKYTVEILYNIHSYQHLSIHIILNCWGTIPRDMQNQEGHIDITITFWVTPAIQTFDICGQAWCHFPANTGGQNGNNDLSPWPGYTNSFQKVLPSCMVRSKSASDKLPFFTYEWFIVIFECKRRTLAKGVQSPN